MASSASTSCRRGAPVAPPSRVHFNPAAAAAKRIARVLWNDPATGVMRHADAGYEAAIRFAKEYQLKRPMEQAE